MQADAESPPRLELLETARRIVVAEGAGLDRLARSLGGRLTVTRADARDALASADLVVVVAAGELARLRGLIKQAPGLVLAVGEERAGTGPQLAQLIGPTELGLWARGGALALIEDCPLVPARAAELAVVVGPGQLGRELAGVLAQRGLAVRTLIATGGEAAQGMDEGAAAWGLAAAGPRPPRVIGVVAPLSTALVKPLTEAARVTAVVLLSPASAAADAVHVKAVLAASGVLLPDTLTAWIETLALLSAYAVPAGDRVRVQAAPGSLVGMSHAADSGAADVTLRALTAGQPLGPSRAGDGVVIPLLAAPGALPADALDRLAADGHPALIGVTAALEAVRSGFALAARRERGLGPAPLDLRGRPRGERETITRALERALRQRPRWLSDHDTKIVLKAFGLSVTRQGVAYSASAAGKLAVRVGLPAELKPHGQDLPSEAEGLRVTTDVRGLAEARRAYLLAAKVSPVEAAVVRETPPLGLELRARAISHGPLGPVLELSVAREGAALACAPAPLRRADAVALAEDERVLRRGADKLDVAALADALFKLSWLIVDLEELDEIRLDRLVVTPRGGPGAVVVDARARVRK